MEPLIAGLHKLQQDIIDSTFAGNIIEWSRPTDMDLNGVEFKALVSGCHNLMRDFV